MLVTVTKHAIHRYRERLFDFVSPEEKIRGLLKQIAHQGKSVSIRPGSWGNWEEVCYQGVSIVLLKNESRAMIITCLGDMRYRKWVKHQDPYERLKGRILYPESEIQIEKTSAMD